MSHHDHPTIRHIRAERRKRYACFYVSVRADATEVLRDADGLLLAWSDYNEAFAAAQCNEMIVVSWWWFLGSYINRLPKPPTAARLKVKTKRGTKNFHAELDVSSDELRTLNVFYDYERRLTPNKVAAALSTAKVWPEDQA